MSWIPFSWALFGVLSLAFGVAVEAQTVAVQVSDLHDRPITGVVLSVSGNGSTSSTDIAGKAQVLAPEGTQPGDPIVLVLVRTEPKNLIFFSPWEGRAIVPKPQGFIGVVLGARGDSAALKNASVLMSLAASLTFLNQRIDSTGTIDSSTRYNAIALFSAELGFKPSQIDASIRAFLAKTDDPSFRQTGNAYLAYYPVPPLRDNRGIAAKHK